MSTNSNPTQKQITRLEIPKLAVKNNQVHVYVTLGLVLDSSHLNSCLQTGKVYRDMKKEG